MSERSTQRLGRAPAGLEPPAIPGIVVQKEPIGTGATGTVYRAREVATNREVALKWLPDLAGTKDQARFQREARAAAALRHDNIAMVYGAGEAEGGRYIVMELVLGLPLSRLLETRAIGPNGLAIVLAKVARALDYAHGQGVVHRDVKPSNIMIDTRGEPRLVDFGLARLLEATTITDPGALVGTLAYMSPEIARGDATSAGPPSDVFSLGCILYEGMAGKAPFLRGGEVTAALTRLVSGKVDPLPPDAPPRLAAVCMAALAVSPAARPPALALAEMLEACVPKERASSETVELARTASLAAASAARSAAQGEATAAARQSGRISPRTTAEQRVPSEEDLLRMEVESARKDPRRVFGNFLILGEVGKGGMGVVYRAWDDRLRRAVALKTIGREASANPNVVNRFRREAEAIAKLRHPSIVSIFEAGELNGVHYLAMELVSGTTLDRRISGEGKLALDRALEAMRDVARAVHYAHEQGVVHRDLKPENIMLDAQGRPHILDFGIARIRDDSTRITKTGTKLGTLAYMPPEQTGGERPVDERSDVYSLGATLYHVLTGHAPFERVTQVEVLAALLSVDPSPPSTYNRRAQGDLDTIVLACLQKDPARRYPSAGALADDLDRYLAGEPIKARPTGRLGRARRWVRRNRALSFASALVVFLGAAGAVLLVGRARDAEATLLAAARDDAERSREVFEKERAKGGEDLVALGFEAFQSALRLAERSPDDAKAREGAFDAACALGEAALASRQWSMAATAYRRAEKLHVNDARARAGLAKVESARTALEKQQKREVEEILREAASGALGRKPLGRETAVFSLVRLASPQTVGLLVEAVDGATRELKAKEGVLDDDRALVLRISCEALGVIGIRERAVPALGRYLALERDEARAAFAGIALSRLGGDEAEAHLLKAMREKFGLNGPFWKQVQAFLGASSSHVDLHAEPRTAIEWNERAEKRRAKGDVLGAIEDETHAIEADPRFTEAWSNRGNAKRDKGDLDGAIADCSKAIELEPAYAPPWINRANAKADKGELDAALADYAKAIELDPRLVPAWSNRAAARQRKGDLAGALEDLVKASDLEPKDGNLWASRGIIEMEKGEREAAIKDLARAVDLDPRHARAWDALGRAKLDGGDADGAIEALGHAVELEPSHAISWNTRGRARITKRDLEGAIADFTRTIELSPTFVAAWNNRGIAKFETGDKKGALADLDRSIELDPNDAVAWNARGKVKTHSEDLDGSIADLTRAIELNPNYAGPWNNRAVSRMHKGDQKGAIEDLTRALELDPKDANTWNNRGRVRHMAGDLDGAIADFTHTLEIAPGYTEAYNNRAVARLAKDDRKGALADLERFLEMAPNDPTAPTVRAKIAELRR